MVKYLLDPQPDVTARELRRILACDPGYMLRRRDEIPAGCERHFVAVDESDSMVPANGAGDDDG